MYRRFSLTTRGRGLDMLRRTLVTWRKEGHSAIVTFPSGENRLTPEFLGSVSNTLDEVEGDDSIRALVTTNEGKIYSNGLPLDLFLAISPEEINTVLLSIDKLFCRLLTFPMVTVAAINGHSFAAGALLALAHDYRLMHKKRGWFCLPETKIKLVFTGGYIHLAKAKVPHSEYVDCIQYGKRYTAQEAKRAGIITEACDEPDILVQSAVDLANEVVSAHNEPYDRKVLTAMKEQVYCDALNSLRNLPHTLTKQL